MKRKGFTLIELLVVIAIIAILAAILFPVFAKARDKARQTACLSNMKQIALGMTQYIQDFDETTPPGLYSWGGGTGWASQIYPYVKSVQTFTCPNETAPGTPVSYAMNSNLVQITNYTQGTQHGTQISQFTSPTKTILLCEVVNNTTAARNYTLPTEGTYNGHYLSPVGNGTGVCTDPDGNNAANCNAGIPTSTTTTMKYATGYFRGVYTGASGLDPLSFTGPEGRHNGGSTFMFADCHVKWLPGNNVSPGGVTNASWAPSCGGYNAGPGAYFAALTTCNDTTIAGTFNYL